MLKMTPNDWNSFWISFVVSLIFFLLSIPLSLKYIPQFTVSQLRKKNKKYIIRKTSFVIRELCDFINSLPFKDDELQKYQIAIFTPKKDLKNHRFVGLLDFDIFNPVSYPKIQIIVSTQIKNLPIEDGFLLLKNEKDRISKLAEKLERIIEVHSLHIDDIIISEISEFCLNIRSFEIFFEYNNSIDDLIERGVTKRLGVIGIMEFAKLCEQSLRLLNSLVDLKAFEIEKKLRD